MKVKDIYINNHSNKQATITKLEKNYVWFEIDGIETVLALNVFKQVYLVNNKK